ncbi:MAG: hypothetical protein SF339_06695 [Blastocatellia bacterium]|nr:hypothetical protein [Blastocatellia bacterium]
MAKKIMTKLREKAAAIALDETGAIGEEVKWASIEALLEGPGSVAMEDYMKMFAETPAQLNRLMLRDSHADLSEVRSSVAYIVGNGVCGTQTGTQTYRFVDPRIDDELG